MGGLVANSRFGSQITPANGPAESAGISRSGKGDHH
jgi:hypothetical protein